MLMREKQKGIYFGELNLWRTEKPTSLYILSISSVRLLLAQTTCLCHASLTNLLHLNDLVLVNEPRLSKWMNK